MRRQRIVLNVGVSLLAVLAAIIVGEVIFRLIWKDPYQWDRRLMFYSEGRNFRNTEWGGFTYQPSSEIHVLTYYITDLRGPELTKEFEYTMQADSNGLIEPRAPDGAKPVLLLLGDSFTEGQGAFPWFYDLQRRWPDGSAYEVMNGGLMATGVQSWELLHRELARRVPVAKILVLFISEDWTRPVWRFDPQVLRCLANAADCTGEENFYGLPAGSSAAVAQVKRIGRLRAEMLHRKLADESLLDHSALYTKLIAPAFRGIRGYIQSGHLGSHRLEQFDVSKRAALVLIHDAGPDNIVFMHIPQKDEVTSGPSWIGRKADRFLEESGFTPLDGFSRCRLTLQDFHVHDGHPNARGYGKLEACVEKALDELRLR